MLRRGKCGGCSAQHWWETAYGYSVFEISAAREPMYPLGCLQPIPNCYIKLLKERMAGLSSRSVRLIHTCLPP